MSTARFTLTLILVLTLLAPGASQSLAQPAASPVAPASPAAPGAMLVIENAGQWPEAARFQVWNSPLGPGTTWLAEDAIWFVGSRQVDKEEVDKEERARCDDPLVYLPTCLPLSSSHTLKLTFPGSNPDVRIEPFGATDTTVSYFLGNDPAQWRPAVPVWGGVRYVDLYPGVDLVLGGSDDAWRLEAAPGAATEQVRVQVEGAQIVTLDGAALRLDTVGGPISLALPTAPFTYHVADVTSVGDPFVVTSPPDLRMSIKDQPNDNPGALLYSTFLGGGLADYAAGITVDGTGSAYVTGSTSSTNFPSTPGALDPIHNGDEDIFVVKLNPGGGALVYATFLGGGDSDRGLSIVIDGTGSAYVTGDTGSSDFPTTPGAYDRHYNGGGGDAFVIKLNPSGSSLDYATYLGGSYGSNGERGDDISIDATGAVYVTGKTYSSDFPATSGAFDTIFNGGSDAFVVKLSPSGGNLVYSTFLGGFYYDFGYAVAVDGAGSAYITGWARSNDFPTTPGAFAPIFNGGPGAAGDAFVTKLNPTGSGLEYSTFLGGSSEYGEWGYGIAVDATGSTYVTGQTGSSDFPITPDAFDSSFNGGDYDTFVVKLNFVGSQLLYATFLGGDGDEIGRDIVVDSTGSACVIGYTASSDFPSTLGAFSLSHNGGIWDAFVIRLNPTGSVLAYSTFLGGNDRDGGWAITVDGTGSALVTGWTASSDFPTTQSAFDTSYNGGNLDAFVARLRIGPYTPDTLAPIEQPTAGTFVSDEVTLRGFAIDRASTTGTGIDMVHIYLDGPYGTGTIIGGATYGLDRPDIAAQYGERFRYSGWELTWDTTGVSPGVHRLYLYAHRTTDNAWSLLDPHLVIVPGGPARWLPIVLRRQ